ncbi:hypothetical protein [Bacillus wiedmannii]|uniref:hypothetical protein n=1 Tax=Bacillus wiedmannii TaxID=1890302 RepID=UPI001C54C1DF|nr:hypothetical protein [Bacillus wiedmannii]
MEDEQRNEIEIITNSAVYVDPNYEIIEESGVKHYLSRIRPAWHAKKLVQRTMNILPVDPSSACQRIFNASIHDLREKVIMAGIDIAQEAAKTYKLPAVTSEEDILEKYDTGKLITLTYRMGMLTRPQYRRVSRVYDIRKDLEHEDDEYEAGVEDVVYIFKTCVDVILANDPVQIIKLTEIKSIVESPDPVSLDRAVIEDYRLAPDPRQTEIYQFLISTALGGQHADIVRQNCYNALGILSTYTNRNTILQAAQHFVDKRLGRRAPLLGEMRVAFVSGILPYLRKAHVNGFYEVFLERLISTGYHWDNNDKHGELLRDLKEIGGITYCSNQDIKDKIVCWLIKCYIGERGGYGVYGRTRPVFYSNSGAPLALEILSEDQTMKSQDIERVISKSPRIKSKIDDKYIMRRYQEILDLYN